MRAEEGSDDPQAREHPGEMLEEVRLQATVDDCLIREKSLGQPLSSAST
ncbi:hypothetical protein [Burkholderia cenocepacia]|nr:hypothetical protein [Burkholderia cenocepacia]